MGNLICWFRLQFFILFFFIFFFLLLSPDLAAAVPIPIRFTSSSSSLSSQTSSLNHTYSNGNSGECDALLHFSNSFIITESTSSGWAWGCYNSYAKTASWKAEGGGDCCSWDGVTCDSASSHVVITGLDLSCSWLQGPLLSDSTLFFLSNLRQLNLGYNNFTGEVPTSICQMSSLIGMDLSYNSLEGTLPPCLGNLSSLTDLSLSHNRLQGLVPSSLANCTSLSKLDLESNQFRGSIGVIGLPRQLIYLSLSNNSFQGPLPIPPHALFYYHISDNEFSGGIPHNSLCNFTSLMSVDISNNHISGTIPRCLMNHTLYKLNLKSNMLHGSIAEIPLPSSLYRLILSNNSFEGPLPIPPPTIDYYMTSNNKFTEDIPHQICNATYLIVVDLSNNFLTGSIPQCFRNYGDSLVVLDLRANTFVGHIPDIFDNNKKLRTLRLSQNGLHGELPRSLAICYYLELLDLSENELEGEFPYWLDALPNLEVLSLRSNKFYGPLGSSNAIDRPFPKLRIFDLSNNNFSGPVPVKYIANFIAMNNEDTNGSLYMDPSSMYYEESIEIVMKGSKIELERILIILATIDLSSNLFNGEIPNAVGDLKALKGLNLSYNNLSGNIPSSLGNLTSLESLDLSSNKLNGEIPRELALLSSLELLNFSNNQLVRQIPQGRQFDTFTSDSFSGNPGLCGHPLPKACEDDAGKTTPSTSHEEEETDSGKWIEWRAMLMGYGCGLALAISAWYVMMETRRPWWLVGMIDRWLLKIVEGKRLGQ